MPFQKKPIFSVKVSTILVMCQHIQKTTVNHISKKSKNCQPKLGKDTVGLVICVKVILVKINFEFVILLTIIINIYIYIIVRFLTLPKKILTILTLTILTPLLSKFSGACFFACLFWRIIWNAFENVVPLQCQMREVETPPIKDKNCEI